MARALFSLLLIVLLSSVAAFAQDQKVLATVNDIPITSYDVDTRIHLWDLLGVNSKIPAARKKALNAIIDDLAKIAEAKKYKAEATEKDIQQRLDRVAQGLKTDPSGLKKMLKSKGISMPSIRLYLEAQFALNRLLTGKFNEKVEVSEAEVDAKYAEIKAQVNGQMAKIKADPRMQPITVMEILEINFPVDSADLLQSRGVEIAQYMSRFKGCGSARKAASGIFNVQVGKKIEADSRKVPAQMKSAFQKAGVGKAIGPFRYPKGLQLWGYCGTRKISPKLPKAELPPRDRVKAALLNEKFDKVEEKYGRLLRKNVLIEYRDPAYAE